MRKKTNTRKRKPPQTKPQDDHDGDIVGDENVEPCDAKEDDSRYIKSLVVQQNKKKKKSGGFQSMGLSQEVFRGIIKKGYRVPTPIQRKTIPLILEGLDVVAMARTGSGKTACFLIPLFERLKARTARSGARALILSPTKELALQTRKFISELGRFTGLKSVCVLGGESMEKQFALIHEHPDIIVATPGRFVHLCVEMGLKLSSLEYVVFDEADRLFEMGFAEQLREILGRLPDSRQTVLFSATLPKLLVDFAKAGLSDPTLVRLDVDTKLPETLQLAFFHCRPEGKSAVLLHVLQTVIPAGEQVVVFCATRHHVEYLHLLMTMAGVENTFIYSHLDSTARKINAAKFAAKRVRVMLVTDLAARGIDIPLLDNVVNFNFPSQSKLFVHRVGRVARAGRTGKAYSLVSGDEMAYFFDLQLFLGRTVTCVPRETNEATEWHNMIGEVPQIIYDNYSDRILDWHKASLDLKSLKDVSDRAYVKYLKSRQAASRESVKRVKVFKHEGIGFHPLLLTEANKGDDERKRTAFLEEMKKFRPASTIFEIGNTTKQAKVKSVMSQKRVRHSDAIEKYHLKERERTQEAHGEDATQEQDDGDQTNGILEESTQADIEAAFGTIVNPKPVKKARIFTKKQKQPKKQFQRDEENFISYQAKDHHTEAGYSLMSSFEAEASGCILDLTGDDDAAQRAKKNVMRWDAKKKKYVKANASEDSGGIGKKIKTESGVWIPASYKSDRYAKWKEKSKFTQLQEQAEEEEHQEGARRGRKRGFQGLPSNHPAMKKAKQAMPKHKRGPKIELKTPEQVLKQRKLQEKKRLKNMKKSKRKKSRA